MLTCADIIVQNNGLESLQSLLYIIEVIYTKCDRKIVLNTYVEDCLLSHAAFNILFFLVSLRLGVSQVKRKNCHECYVTSKCTVQCISVPVVSW